MTSRSEAGQPRSVRWTTAEIAELEMLAGNVPTPELFRKYNKWAARQKPPFPQRTEIAIYHQAKQNGISFRCFGDCLAMQDVANILNISSSRVRRWVDRELIKVNRQRYCYVSRADLAAMAWKHPQALHSIDRDRLYRLLEAEDVVEHVLLRANVEPGPSRPRPVRCVETGFTWPSITAASRAVFVDPGSISKGIRRGWAIAGRHWEFVA